MERQNKMGVKRVEIGRDIYNHYSGAREIGGYSHFRNS